MKYLKTIPFLFFAIQQLHAQYIPLVAENKYWFYERYNGSPDSGSPQVVSAYALTFKGDTIISGKPYKKVIELELEGKHNCQFPPCFDITIPYVHKNKRVVGFMNEDLTSKRILFIPLEKKYCSETEHELFNFSLQKGDSLTTCMAKVLTLYKNKLNPNLKSVVDSVKTELSFNKLRNTIFTTGAMNTSGLIALGRSEIVEEVGHQRFGLLYPSSLGRSFSKFCEGTLKDCEFNTATKNTINQAHIRIFPNPTSDKVMIESQENIETILIYDINGKTLILDNQYNTQDISQLANGMYVMKIKFDNGFQYFHKLIKQ